MDSGRGVSCEWCDKVSVWMKEEENLYLVQEVC